MTREKQESYFNRTGDLFALNLLAKASEFMGAVGMYETVSNGWGAKEAAVAATLGLGGLALDAATGGVPRLKSTVKKLINQ